MPDHQTDIEKIFQNVGVGKFAAILAIALSVLYPQAHLDADQTEMVTNLNDIKSFIAAARANDVDTAKQLVARGVPVDSTDERGRTALLVATYQNAVEVARYLIDAGADVNLQDDLQDSPYLYAGAEGKLDILKMMVAAGADLDSTNRYGGTALIPAAHHGHIDVVRYLLTTKTNIDHVNHLGWTALLEAVILGDGSPTYQEIVKLLVDAGADISIADNNGVTPLEHAKAGKQDEVVNILVSANTQ